jgi:hypothetical protein
MPNPLRTVTPFKRILIGPHRPRLQSHVRFRPPPADQAAVTHAYEMLDAMSEDLTALSIRLESLENALRMVSYDPSSCAAAQTALTRSRELGQLVELLFVIHSACSWPAPAPLLSGDGPLADYLRGVVTWSCAVVRTLEELASELNAHAPNWMQLRSRLGDASAFLLGELVEPVREDLESLAKERSDRALDELRAMLEQLFVQTETVGVSLGRRFG